MTDIMFRNIDTDMLNEQRMLLIDRIWDDEDTPLWGLVNMLDDWYDNTYPPEEI